MSHFKSTLEESVVPVVWNNTVFLGFFWASRPLPVLVGIFSSGGRGRGPGGTPLLSPQGHRDSQDMLSWALPSLARTNRESGLPGDHLPASPDHVYSSSFWIRRQLNYRDGEETGNPLQCSCLENPMDRGVWWAAVYGVTKSRTRLSDEHTLTIQRCAIQRSKRNGYFFSFLLFSFFLDFKMWNGLVEMLSIRCLIFSCVWDRSWSLGRKAADLLHQTFKRLLSGLLFWGPSKWKNVKLGMK